VRGAERNLSPRQSATRLTGRLVNGSVHVAMTGSPCVVSRVFPRSYDKPPAPPATPDPVDYEINAVPSTGYHHPTAWLSPLPAPARRDGVQMPGDLFARLVLRVQDHFHSGDQGRGRCLVRDGAVGLPSGPGRLHVRVISDSVKDDRHLGNLLHAVALDVSKVGRETFKRLRDWPFHIEVLHAAQFRMAKPERYGLPQAPFVAINYETRQIVAGAGATGNDVAAAVQELATHLISRDGTHAVVPRAALVESRKTGAQALVVGLDAAAALAATGADSPLRLVGAGAVVTGPGGSASPLWGGVAAHGEQAIKALGAGRGVLVAHPEGGKGSPLVSSLLSSSSSSSFTSPKALVLLAESAEGPFAAKLQPGQAGQRFLVGPKADGSASCYLSASEKGVASLKQLVAAFSATLDTVPAYLVHPERAPASLAQALADLADGGVVAQPGGASKEAMSPGKNAQAYNDQTQKTLQALTASLN
jgi:hypothetical protein